MRVVTELPAPGTGPNSRRRCRVYWVDARRCRPPSSGCRTAAGACFQIAALAWGSRGRPGVGLAEDLGDLDRRRAVETVVGNGVRHRTARSPRRPTRPGRQDERRGTALPVSGRSGVREGPRVAVWIRHARSRSSRPVRRPPGNHRVPVNPDYMQELIPVRGRRPQRRQHRGPRRHQRPTRPPRRAGSRWAATPSSTVALGRSPHPNGEIGSHRPITQVSSIGQHPSPPPAPLRVARQRARLPPALDTDRVGTAQGDACQTWASISPPAASPDASRVTVHRAPHLPHNPRRSGCGTTCSSAIDTLTDVP